MPRPKFSLARGGTIALAFVFFVPFWHDVMFSNSPLKRAGLYPFIGVCFIVAISSLIAAIEDRRHALANRHTPA